MAVTHGHGNPRWTRDEVILALDLYLACNGNIPSKGDRRVKELSELLRKLPYHQVAARKSTFRNADGVAFKLQNIRKVATGKGLGNVSENDREVWEEFGGKPERVHLLASVIRSAVESGTLGEVEIDEGEEFSEGRTMTAMHKKRERNRAIRGRLLGARKKMGPLRCDMCQGGSWVVDDSIGDAMFEAHHRVLLSTSEERITRIVDMALLCANCHRLLHRGIASSKRWIAVEEGRELLAAKPSTTG